MKYSLLDFLPEQQVQRLLKELWRRLPPSWLAQLKRMPELAPVKPNPLLTKEYLEGHELAGLEKQVNRLLGEILTEQFLAKPHGLLGGVKFCPPETVSRQKKKKMGRPTKYGRAMTPAERWRHKRGKPILQHTPLLIPGRMPWNTLSLDGVKVRKRKQAKYSGPGGILSE
jgi:hypothetical protein